MKGQVRAAGLALAVVALAGMAASGQEARQRVAVKVGDVVRKDGATGTVTVVRPDGAFEVELKEPPRETRRWELPGLVGLETFVTLTRSHQLAARYVRVPATLDTAGNDYPHPTFKPANPKALEGRSVLVISADGPELPELDVPIEFLRARGATVKLAGQDWIFRYRNPAGHIVIAQWLADNVCVKADLRLSDVKVEEYDAIFIPGGAWNPDMLRTDEKALEIVREARKQGKLIVSLCHGPQVLINANRVSTEERHAVFPVKTKITGVANILVDLENAGFKVFNDNEHATVYDEPTRLLTARNPNDLGPLCEEMERLLAARPK